MNRLVAHRRWLRRPPVALALWVLAVLAAGAVWASDPGDVALPDEMWLNLMKEMAAKTGGAEGELEVELPAGSVVAGETSRVVVKLPAAQESLNVRLPLGGGGLGALHQRTGLCIAGDARAARMDGLAAIGGRVPFCLQVAEAAAGETLLLLEAGDSRLLHPVKVSPRRGEIVAPKAADRTYRFRRARSSRSAGGGVRLTLIETGKADIGRLTLRASRMRGEGPNLPRICARRLDQTCGCPGPGLLPEGEPCPSELAFPPSLRSGDVPVLEKGADAHLDFELTGFDRSGEFEMDLLLDSDDLAKPVVVPIKVVVTDGPILPFAVILLGVLVAFLITRALRRLEAARELVRAAASFGKEARRKNWWLRAARWSNRLALVPKEGVVWLMDKAVEQGPADAGTDAVDHLENARDQVRKSRVEAGQYGLLVVALVLGAATGFNELYFAGAFGAPEQYLGAFLWGLSSRFAVGTLTALIKKLAPSLAN